MKIKYESLTDQNWKIQKMVHLRTGKKEKG